MQKHVDPTVVIEIRRAFWEMPRVIQLLDPKTQKPLNKFTTKQIIEEEKRAVRLADKLVSTPASTVKEKKVTKFTEPLNAEQKVAFKGVITGSKLSCIEGDAGTGKSYLLNSLREAYEASNFTVRGLGPDTSTKEVLIEKGFPSPETAHAFLFGDKNGKRQIRQNREVWILDEAGKLGTAPLIELLKCANKYGAQLILAGDSKQLPSVERGGMLSLYVNKYGAQHLRNIQRQETQTQREIAKMLAKGDMGAALDAIVKEGGIKWHSSKEAALESIITAWALHRVTHPDQTSLLTAFSNKEVKVLNELVRLYRKEAGELPAREFACDTDQGIVYVSCGDEIEFREKNQKMGVQNGTQGILIKATTSQFTVQLSEEDKKRQITFNPQKYRKFQLGYATTQYRSQGRTTDRAFVLHSPMMDKALFYVDLTRHVKQAELYVSEQEVKSLSDLKRQALKSHGREFTLEYLPNSDLQNQLLEKNQKEKLQKLKSSDSMVSKVKGHGLSTWIGIRSKVHKAMEIYHDKSANEVFFNPDLTKNNLGPGKVVEVEAIDQNDLKAKVFDQELIANKERMQTSFKGIIAADRESPPAKPQTRERFTKLSVEHKSLVDRYFQGIDRASSLYTIVKSQGAEKGTSTFEDWQKACGKRNQYAHDVLTNLSEKDAHKIFKRESWNILNDRATKYAAHLDRQNPQINYDERLKDNLDALLHRLFPEGPTGRDRDGLRFGSKQSLKVTCTGGKAGSFFDFSENIGGGPIQLIQKELLFTKSEAFNWAKDFLGEAHNIEVPTQFNTKNLVSKQSEWISLKPDPKDIAPALKMLSSRLANNYTETQRHTYRDQEGNVLFHTLRLEDRNEPKGKIVLPLSYGRNPESDQSACWSLKGYQADKKPLYNLHLLREFPDAKVLLVEGEKTADAASKLFPNNKMICLTWSGGAGAVLKSDWSPLFVREVVIWPDNDKAGYEASEVICSELRKVGIKSLREVDKTILAQALPSKWDLADSVPSSLEKSFIKDTLLRANERGVGLGALMSHIKMQSKTIDTGLARDVLCEVEERLRPGLEKQFGKHSSEIKNALLSEVMNVLEERARFEQLGTKICARSEKLEELEASNTTSGKSKYFELER